MNESFFFSLIGFFIVLTPLIFFHELGHYYAAIKSGVKVETFSIGFGPELLGFSDKNNTRWKLSLIPLGGYVKMKGELVKINDNLDKKSFDKDAFLQAGLLSRMLIVFSGPLANLFLGLILITSLYCFNGRYESSTIINTVIDSQPAKLAGILPEAQMRELVKAGEVNLLTPFQIEGILGDDKVTGVTLKNFDTKESITHDADELLFLFGLNKKLGPILEWELELASKKIAVNTENFQTNRDGIFAVGDINDYPGKLDLILCGFHETTLAVQKAFQRNFPGERVPFGYTTSNTKLQRKLGVAE